MFGVFCRRRVWISPKDCVFVSQHYAAVVKPFSPRKSTPSVCENDSQRSFTVSYLINSCGLSSKNAVSASGKLSFRSPEKPNAVLDLLRQYGFTDAHIPRIVTRWPEVLLASPDKILLPKLEFFLSIRVSRPLLAHKLSLHPTTLRRSLKNSLIPFYNYLKSLLQSDERVVCVFSRASWIFGIGRCCSKGINMNISMLRERGVPESCIVSLVMHQPSVLTMSKEKLAVYVDRALTMGFDVSRSGFITAIRVFLNLSNATLKQKMEVYRKCGWSEYDIGVAFSRNPHCMSISEKKITVNMGFLVDEFGCKPVDVAWYPVLLAYNLDRRIKPRCLVARILNDKGLKNITGAGRVSNLLNLSEAKFLTDYIVKYQKDIPELLDIYRGK